jgi:uncharacterized protein (TIGR03437 family)
MTRRQYFAFLLAVPAFGQLFQPVGSVPFGSNGYYAIADFNLDGRLDFARASVNSHLTLSLGSPDGTFAGVSSDTAIEAPAGLVQGDFDNDGRPDVAVFSAGLFTEPSVRVYLASTSLTFTSKPFLLLNDLVRASATGDFDADGNLDIAIVTTTPSGTSLLSVLKGNGKGELAPPFLSAPVTLPVPSGTIAGDLQVADFNRDKKLDLVMTVTNTTGVGLAVATGDGRGSFTVVANLGSQPPLTNPSSHLALADFNGDQNMDVVMFGYQKDRVTVWLNSGGTLIPQTSTSVNLGTGPYGIAAADFDLDGRMDWAVTRQISLGAPELFVGLGNGTTLVTIAPGSPFPYGGPTPLLATGDFNGDRRQDLLVLEGDSQAFRILLNIVSRPPTLSAQEIHFPEPGDFGLTGGPFTPTVTASSGLPVTLAGVTNAVCTVSKGVITFVTTGVCTVIAIQRGDQTYSPAPIVQRTFNISRNTQTITFAALPDRALDSLPFPVSATSSSGLTVSFAASPASVCTLSGTTVALVAVGQCTVTASQAGNATFPAATPVTRTFTVTPVVILGPRVESIANAASYAAGTLAPASYGALFGLRLSNAVIRLRDSAGATHTLEQTFSGETQINFIVPGNAARGEGAVTATTPNGASEFPVTIAATAPGLFSSNGTGQGLAAAQALIVNNDRTITTLTVADGPIPVRGGTEIYLVLYGTGIRGRAPNSTVFVSVAGTPVEVLYAGPQGTFPALDQINVKVPLSVGGFGAVDIRLIVDGLQSNIVKANFQ